MLICDGKETAMRRKKYPNADQTMQAFYDAVSESYNHPATGEEVGNVPGKKKQELLAEEFGLSRIKVRKILITTGDLVYKETSEIESLLREGMSVSEAAEKLKIAVSTANSFLPYTKGVYKLSEVSAAAERTHLYRERKEAVKQLKAAVEKGEWSPELWRTIICFAGYPFQTTGCGSKPGVKFRYTVSRETEAVRRYHEAESAEVLGNEMRITTSDDKKQKSISRLTVERTFSAALEIGGKIKRPGALNVSGAHVYLYPIFFRLEIIPRVLPKCLDSNK